ncbi:MAG TPA: GNAT family N-acetyltransferase [Albitalea sp.]|nr:GNAT family N-acetyltransferase [Albitalea sp.]
MPFPVKHNTERSRFEAHVDGHLCVADYHLSGGVMHMTHTFVPPDVGGRGVAAALVRNAFAYAREQGYRVDPACSYVRTYMRRHPETQSLHA